MDPKTARSDKKTKIILLIITLLIAVGLVAWLVGRSNKSTSTSQSTSGTSGNTSGTDVKSLVSYSLPDAWTENVCPASNNTTYIIPNSASLDCGSNPSAPIKAFVDSQNTTDCQQLKPANVTGIKKHVCISLYIDGHKSLKASTTYSSGSSYSTDTTISDYFINTGKGVATFEYTHTSSNTYQIGFDQLATSTKVK